MIFMKTLNTTWLMAIVWSLGMGATGLLLQVDSSLGWFVAGALACGPAAVLWYATTDAVRTTSQLIQDAKQ